MDLKPTTKVHWGLPDMPGKLNGHARCGLRVRDWQLTTDWQALSCQRCRALELKWRKPLFYQDGSQPY